jgi:serine/threonine protein kinase
MVIIKNKIEQNLNNLARSKMKISITYRQMMKSILESVLLLHNMGIVHRDLKVKKRKDKRRKYSVFFFCQIKILIKI